MKRADYIALGNPKLHRYAARTHTYSIVKRRWIFPHELLYSANQCHIIINHESHDSVSTAAASTSTLAGSDLASFSEYIFILAKSKKASSNALGVLVT